MGFEAHLHFGPDNPDSWLVTPKGRRIELEPYRHVFHSTFYPPSVFDDPPAHGILTRVFNAYRGGTVTHLGSEAGHTLTGGFQGAVEGDVAVPGKVMFIVDSGADVHIAGDFIYSYDDVVCRNPDVSIRGVDGELTPVDSIVSTTIVFECGQFKLDKVYVCDAFKVA